MTLTLGSLFNGISGWILAGQKYGVETLWESEIEAFPEAVTKHHFPDVVQLGDITKLDGAELPPVDIVCAGSPCQDLSVAGKQEGLKGARSGLFLRAVDIVRRMRFATGGQYPRFFVWENVPGAFSSNRGMDFQAVLEEIGESAVPMPEGNRWAPAGLVQFPGAEIAWRVLDAQYWGVPQRRKRIFLVADFTGRSAGEILFECEGVRGDSSQGGKAREGAAAEAESGANGASVVRMRAGCAGGGKGALVSRERSLTLAANTNDQVLFTGNCLTPAAKAGMCGGNLPLVSYAISGNIIGRENQNGGHHMGVDKDVSFTLNTVDRHAVCVGNGQLAQVKLSNIARSLSCMHDQQAVMYTNTVGALCADDHKGINSQYVDQDKCVIQKSVRRLTPLECERLQGLPDFYTLIDDKTCSDTARYKALGNGMAQPCADYVIRRIVEVCGND